MLLALHLTAHSELLLRLSLKDTTKYCLVVLAVLPALIVKPIDNKYLVYYNVYENKVFCGWDRLVEEVELLTPT
jgi:hypothetical protein